MHVVHTRARARAHTHTHTPAGALVASRNLCTAALEAGAAAAARLHEAVGALAHTPPEAAPPDPALPRNTDLKQLPSSSQHQFSVSLGFSHPTAPATCFEGAFRGEGASIELQLPNA